MPNCIIVASAGSGKTTSIVQRAAGQGNNRSALVTYTHNGVSELRDKALQLFGCVPESIEIGSWYNFLLRHFVRPYQNYMYETPVRRVNFVDGRSAKYVRKTDTERYFFSEPGRIYVDKISEFACRIIEISEGLPLGRIQQIVSQIYIDEAQDLAGYDLDLIEHLLRSDVAVTLVGDVRQATYKTNHSARNSQFGGAKIAKKFEEWCSQTDTTIEYHALSHRCVQSICDFADQFFPELPPAKSLNERVTNHDGVFAVRQSDVEAYMGLFNPQTLRLDRRTREVPGFPLNFGEAKGKTFERTLIFPHKKLEAVLSTGKVAMLGSAEITISRVYVGITRARQSVGFVIPDNLTPAGLEVYSP